MVAGLLYGGCGRTHDSRYDDYPGLRPAGSGSAGNGAAGKGGSGAAGASGVSGGGTSGVSGGTSGVGGGGVSGAGRGGVGGDPNRPFCGNGVLDDFEECEGEQRFSCSEVGFGSGIVRCDPKTCRLDTSSCTDRPQVCKNNAPRGLSPLCVNALCSCDPGLVASCDDDCWREIQCRVRVCGSAAGDFSCRPEVCKPQTTSQELGFKLLSCVQGNRLCGPDPRNEFCGDGVANFNEQCDGMDLRGTSCESSGFGSGFVFCDSGCVIDFSGCSANTGFCGNGVIDPGEQCDGGDFDGATCRSIGLPAGELGCTKACSFDTRRCGGLCGNGVIDSGEQCDGMRLNGRTCASLGFGSGALFCGSDCRFDDSLCAACGNGAIEAGENCDGANLGGVSCSTLGLGGGSLACSPTSCHFDTRGCMAGAACGNGVAEADEQCDGMDFTALTCDTLGFRFGALGCNSRTCRFDLSECQGAGSIECVDQCIDDQCLGLVEKCLASPDCQKIRSCLDSCRNDPSVNCGLACTGNLEGVALATVASDCVADCVDGCR